MDENYKAIVILALIILALFAGGLYYVFRENQNRTLALNEVQQYRTETDPDKRASLEQDIRLRISKRPIALTSYASFDSFDKLIANADACDQVAVSEMKFDPLNRNRSYDEIWRDCMDHPDERIPKN